MAWIRMTGGGTTINNYTNYTYSGHSYYKVSDNHPHVIPEGYTGFGDVIVDPEYILLTKEEYVKGSIDYIECEPGNAYNLECGGRSTNLTGLSSADNSVYVFENDNLNGYGGYCPLSITEAAIAQSGYTTYGDLQYFQGLLPQTGTLFYSGYMSGQWGQSWGKHVTVYEDGASIGTTTNHYSLYFAASKLELLMVPEFPLNYGALVPTLSTYTGEGVTVSACSETSDCQVWKAFDQATGTRFAPSDGNNNWVLVEFDTAKVVDRIGLYCTAHGCSNWALQVTASNDGESWTTLYEANAPSYTDSGAAIALVFTNTAQYTKYKLTKTTTGGTDLTISEMQLYGPLT